MKIGPDDDDANFEDNDNRLDDAQNDWLEDDENEPSADNYSIPEDGSGAGGTEEKEERPKDRKRDKKRERSGKKDGKKHKKKHKKDKEGKHKRKRADTGDMVGDEESKGDGDFGEEIGQKRRRLVKKGPDGDAGVAASGDAAADDQDEI